MEPIIIKRINWIGAIISGIYGIFVFFFIILIFLLFINDFFSSTPTLPLILFALFVLILLGFWIIDTFLWQIKGYEIIEIIDKVLIIRKKGKLFASKKEVSFFEIDKIQVKNYPTTVFNVFYKIMGIKGGKINIKYLGREMYIGQGLTDQEAFEYVEALNKLLFDYRRTLAL
jgi:hypothetical protein